jgi:superfamily II DNA helicase RecQ
MDVAEALLPAPPQPFDAPLVRANVVLRFRAGSGEGRQRAILETIRGLPRPLLVLGSTPREVDSIHDALRTMGLPAYRYHEELRTGARAAEQLQFSMPGDRAVLVATSAFAVGAARDEDAEGVPLRYGLRTKKRDIRALVRCKPPQSVEQLVDELSLLGRDGARADAIVFADPTDRAALEAEVEASRPSGEQLLMLGRALEAAFDQSPTVTTEALALAARSSLRAVQTLGGLLHGMGLVKRRDGWLIRTAQSHVLHRELRSLAERYATVRALDARRLAAVAELASHRGCATWKLRALLGDAEATACGTCPSCQGVLDTPHESMGAAPVRRNPARRFTVTAGGVAEISTSTFHSDRMRRQAEPLTAKLADFKS